MQRLEGKVAVVTGGGRGIGRGTARVLAAEGASVMVSSRTLAHAEETVASIHDQGGRAAAFPCDVCYREQVDAMVAATVEAFGPPDILVNNAQGGGKARAVPPTIGEGHAVLATATDDDFLAAFEGGVLSSLYGMQAVFPHMQERGGSIVNMASSTGILGDPGFAPYGTAKEGIRGLTKHAAREWGPFGIRVNAVAPAALGEGAIAFRDAAPARWDAILRQVPLRYMGDPEDDIGRGILALVTDLQYLTGATLALDGGRCILR